MKNQHQEHVIGIPVSSSAIPVGTMNKHGKKADSFVNGVREHGKVLGSLLLRLRDYTGFHKIPSFSFSFLLTTTTTNLSHCSSVLLEHTVRLAPNISETVKGKLSLGARILQVGGVERIFKQLFRVREGEKLLKASQCNLSTTAGPIADLLFISPDKIAFCSERAIKFSSANGDSVRIHYKVLIPLRKIKIANQSENTKRPSQKYLEIITTDNFEFWFMGFLNYQKAFKYLQQALSQA